MNADMVINVRLSPKMDNVVFLSISTEDPGAILKKHRAMASWGKCSSEFSTDLNLALKLEFSILKLRNSFAFIASVPWSWIKTLCSSTRSWWALCWRKQGTVTLVKLVMNLVRQVHSWWHTRVNIFPTSLANNENQAGRKNTLNATPVIFRWGSNFWENISHY